eukprot:TRINITY_DN10626_c0_g1_i2.p1 TRINITY_DN10626_c0_g1~~TRINITY_DN10626_c0_g1_i2.p1  ORF type:complete len:275 (-),score=62.21 TRINITY_DN10626_c0_g1_i2:36-860(-)
MCIRDSSTTAPDESLLLPHSKTIFLSSPEPEQPVHYNLEFLNDTFAHDPRIPMKRIAHVLFLHVRYLFLERIRERATTLGMKDCDLKIEQNNIIIETSDGDPQSFEELCEYVKGKVEEVKMKEIFLEIDRSVFSKYFVLSFKRFIERIRVSDPTLRVYWYFNEESGIFHLIAYSLELVSVYSVINSACNLCSSLNTIIKQLNDKENESTAVQIVNEQYGFFETVQMSTCLQKYVFLKLPRPFIFPRGNQEAHTCIERERESCLLYTSPSPRDQA